LLIRPLTHLLLNHQTINSSPSNTQKDRNPQQDQQQKEQSAIRNNQQNHISNNPNHDPHQETFHVLLVFSLHSIVSQKSINVSIVNIAYAVPNAFLKPGLIVLSTFVTAAPYIPKIPNNIQNHQNNSPNQNCLNKFLNWVSIITALFTGWNSYIGMAPC